MQCLLLDFPCAGAEKKIETCTLFARLLNYILTTNPTDQKHETVGGTTTLQNPSKSFKVPPTSSCILEKCPGHFKGNRQVG